MRWCWCGEVVLVWCGEDSGSWDQWEQRYREHTVGEWLVGDVIDRL